MKGIPGPVLADVAANVLVVTVVVLIALAQMVSRSSAPMTPMALTPAHVAPIGGVEAIELLRQRLLLDATGLVDVRLDMTLPSTPVRALLVLDPRAYPDTLARLREAGADWRELTVPKALMTRDNRWHPDFLGLASLANDPERFRIGLQDLLARRMAIGGGASSLGSEGEPGIRLRFTAWFRTALDLLGFSTLLIAFWALLRLRRWALRA